MTDGVMQDTEMVVLAITQYYIDAGQINDCWFCPAARALADMFPGLVPEVTQDEIRLLSPETYEPVLQGETEHDLEMFIQMLDAGLEVFPGVFILTLRRCDQVKPAGYEVKNSTSAPAALNSRSDLQERS